ncbi:MAG: hypothetical protein CMJ80_06100 [Planctomycetaceae bacterium]|nr:hypothetical protein [Planctomycetaceae bacterium]
MSDIGHDVKILFAMLQTIVRFSVALDTWLQGLIRPHLLLPFNRAVHLFCLWLVWWKCIDLGCNVPSWQTDLIGSRKRRSLRLVRYPHDLDMFSAHDGTARRCFAAVGNKRTRIVTVTADFVIHR